MIESMSGGTRKTTRPPKRTGPDDGGPRKSPRPPRRIGGTLDGIGPKNGRKSGN